MRVTRFASRRLASMVAVALTPGPVAIAAWWIRLGITSYAFGVIGAAIVQGLDPRSAPVQRVQALGGFFFALMLVIWVVWLLSPFVLRGRGFVYILWAATFPDASARHH